jgi:MFS family permease
MAEGYIAGAARGTPHVAEQAFDCPDLMALRIAPAGWSLLPTGVKALIGTATLVSVARTMSLPFLAIHLSQHVGLDASSVGLIIGTGAVVASLGGLFGGSVSDKVGRRTIFIGALALASVSFGAMYLASAPAAFFVLNALTALANSFYEPLSRALLGDHVSPALRQQAFSYRYVANNIGWAIGPIVGALLGIAGGSVGFLVTGLILLAIAALLAVTLPRDALAASRMSGPPGETFEFRRAARLILRDARMRWLVVGSTVAIASYGQMSITFSQYIAGTYADGVVLFAKIVVVNPITIILTQPLMSGVARRLQPYRSLFVGCAVLAASNIVFLAAPSPVWLGVGMFVFTLGEMLIVPAEYELINRFSPQAYRGTYFGVHSLGEVGNFLGPWTGGLILVHFGGAAMFLYFALVAVAAGIAPVRWTPMTLLREVFAYAQVTSTLLT